MRKLIFGAATHGVAVAIGFALGVYFLPVLIAPAAPDSGALQKMAAEAIFKGQFSRDLRGSDFLHWGEGTVSITPTQIVHDGRLAPGPDYKLYLVKDFVDHEDAFLPIKQDARLIGDVKSFDGFVLDIPKDVDVADYTTVLVWCEAFSEFITAVKYR